MAKKKKSSGNSIARNKKASFDYTLQDKTEAGIALLGWEVKSIRAGMVQLTESYVMVKDGEAWLHNVHITPLPTASTHFVTDPRRTRKLLLKQREISRLEQAMGQQGYTIVATALYWKGHLVKCEIALAKGKQNHDKREAEKQKDWSRDKQRLFQTAQK